MFDLHILQFPCTGSYSHSCSQRYSFSFPLLSNFRIKSRSFPWKFWHHTAILH